VICCSLERKARESGWKLEINRNKSGKRNRGGGGDEGEIAAGTAGATADEDDALKEVSFGDREIIAIDNCDFRVEWAKLWMAETTKQTKIGKQTLTPNFLFPQEEYSVSIIFEDTSKDKMITTSFKFVYYPNIDVVSVQPYGVRPDILAEIFPDDNGIFCPNVNKAQIELWPHPEINGTPYIWAQLIAGLQPLRYVLMLEAKPEERFGRSP